MISFIPLKVLMLKRNISAKTLKQQEGLTCLNLKRMFDGTSAVRTVVLDRLCKYFKCRLSDIVEYVPDEEWDFERRCKKDKTDPISKLDALSESQRALQEEIEDLKKAYPAYLL